MTNGTNPAQELELLRDMIITSIDSVKQNVVENHDPPLTLHTLDEHPIYRREDPKVTYALKVISSAGQMLRAICDPNTYMNDFTYGYHDQTALLVACQADVPNHLGDRHRHVDELAEATGLNPDRLGRFLRSLCNSHIFEEVGPNRFTNNALSVRYRSEAWRAIVGHCVDGCRPASCKTWDALTLPEYKDATAPTKSPFNIAYDTPLDYFKFATTVRPELAQRTQKAMGGKAFNLGQYLSLYPWAREGNSHIVDVGGAIGAATMPVLRAFPGLRLTVQDLPDSGPVFEKNLHDNFADLAKRGGIQFIPMDFFEESPLHGAEIYFMRHVIHDWPEKEAVKILKGCASAMTPRSKLLICEHMVRPTYRVATEDKSESQEPPAPLLANWGDAPTSRLDLQVYTFVNAKQRTRAEYEDLAEQAGLEVAQVWCNLGDLSIVECRLRSV